jgi:hypothetical protein
MVPIEVAFHAVFGIGTAIVLRSGLVLAPTERHALRRQGS